MQLGAAQASPAAPWVALLVKPRAERAVETGLGRSGLETFVPWYRTRRRWSDRTAVIEQNLFPGYLFCRSRFEDRRIVLGHPGVRGVVSFDRTPAIIPDEEILALQRAISSALPVRPWQLLRKGQRVRIARGALAGLEGTLSRDPTACRVVLTVSALQRSVAVEVDPDMVVAV